MPKFNNNGKMVFNWFEWRRDSAKKYPKIHPTQKPVNVLKRLIEIFTDEGDVVIDPVAGSASTLRAASEMRRNCYGFEVGKDFYNLAQKKILSPICHKEEIEKGMNQLNMFSACEELTPDPFTGECL